MKGKLKIPTTVLSALQHMVTQLHRLVGGKITIRRFQFWEDNSSFIAVKEIKLRFTNRGQTVVVIDESIYLEPMESFVEGDDLGPGIDHEYTIRFLDVAVTAPETAQAKSAASGDGFTFNRDGNLLDIRAMYRNY
ncbi:MAG: hypothetical protein AAFZ52_11195 [Bacteroidota bacterium]